MKQKLHIYLYTLLLGLAAIPAEAQTLPFVEEGEDVDDGIL